MLVELSEHMEAIITVDTERREIVRARILTNTFNLEEAFNYDPIADELEEDAWNIASEAGPEGWPAWEVVE